MGQICTATSRIYVQDAVYDDFVQKFKEYTIANTKLGNQFDPESTHGPQVSANQLKRILSYVGLAKSEGAELVLGGVAGSGKGYFIEPTIFKDVHNNMKVVREEIFGPFALFKFSRRRRGCRRRPMIQNMALEPQCLLKISPRVIGSAELLRLVWFGYAIMSPCLGETYSLPILD